MLLLFIFNSCLVTTMTSMYGPELPKSQSNWINMSDELPNWYRHGWTDQTYSCGPKSLPKAIPLTANKCSMYMCVVLYCMNA